MAKKKRVVRKSSPQLSEHGSSSSLNNEKEEAGDGVTVQEETITEMINNGEFAIPPSPIHERFARDPHLTYQEPLIKNGIKIAQVDPEEVKFQAANWSSAVICMVLGENPPMAVFEGYIKRIWGHLGIAQIARMTMGLTMVKFNDEATKDLVLENGVFQFDRKPVIVRPWSSDLDAVKLIRSVPLWIRLHDLGLQYWGNKCLRALVSTIGKPIMVDQFTRDRTRIQFARILVEMDITDAPPRMIQFLNEKGQLVEQGIDYEWLPMKCKTCLGYGHIMADCRKGEVEKKVRNIERNAHVTKPEEHSQIPPISSPVSSKMQPSGSGKKDDKALSKNDWKTPRKTTGLRMKEHVPGSTSDHDQEAGQRSVNVFSILQDKEGYEEEVVECRETKGFGGLLETKLKGNKVQELMDKKFTSWEFYNSPIVEGRLLIIWRKSFVRVLVIAKSSQHVHCVVKMAGQVNAFCLTFVYGFNTIEDRKILWQNLVQLNFPVSPWLILGDFNSVFYVDDRNGGNPITHTKMVDSNLWLAQSNVVALKSFGSIFTWTNNQVGSNRIYSKIDHVFVNEEWHDFFPNTATRFSWEAISDHCSCVVSASATETIGIKPFQFYNFWVDHHDFKSMVEQSWKRPLTSRGLKGIYLKLMRVKHCLKKFNHEVIGDIGKSYQEAKSCYSEAKFQA
ncbi:uncharacterized protein LOC133785700 [Humulus lupulus]|uniref:uncharacterized protein LOC133785700 n=1 Tax=Humulus lupulus TaxID=3486 RepID=UPI002B4086E1|nr:uncharacterized protein LOC133785700 [Humulus lupulus]